MLLVFLSITATRDTGRDSCQGHLVLFDAAKWVRRSLTCVVHASPAPGETKSQADLLKPLNKRPAYPVENKYIMP